MNYKVATIGFFDGVHRGHQHVLARVVAEARQRGCQTMAVTFDRHPMQLFCPERAPKLICSLEEKVRLIREQGIAEVVVLPFNIETATMPARDFMEKILRDELGITTLVIGYDNRFGHRDPQHPEGFEDYQRYGQELGIEVINCDEFTLPDTNVSSTRIREYIKEENIAMAEKCLGR